MKDININNYEAYLLDLAEGELSPADEKLLMLFLDKHPEIKAEHELFEIENILADNIYFDNKSDLKKTAILSDMTSSNFDELCIAKLEGDLTKEELAEFNKFLKSDKIREKEYDLYKLAQLVPNQNVVYQKKHKLKKKEARAFTFKRSYSVVSAAASIIILIGLYLFMPKQNENNNIVSELDQTSRVEKTQEIVQEEEIPQIIIKEEIESDQIKVADQTTLQIQVEEIPHTIEEKNAERNLDPIAMLDPVELDYNFGHKSIEGDIVNVIFYETPLVESTTENSMSLRSYLASRFNKRVFKKEYSEKVELFDIAQAGVEGINKITGTKMSLERVYKENGTADRTEFNSRLLAFSTPAKKN